MMFLPTTPAEVKTLGWDSLDIILITGDSYIDSPFIGAAVIGRVLQQAGYKVGILAQPAVDSPADITRLGEPRLFWGVTGGSVDSMVANYTALKKKRRSDDYTPGGTNTRRPDRALIAYANLIRRYYKHTCPIVLGGIEASLRRVAHYDYWDDAIRRSVLFDAKADYLLYGMAEASVVELAKALSRQQASGESLTPQTVRGLCYIARQPVDGYVHLPSYEQVAQEKVAFIQMFHTFYHNNDPLTASGLCQQHGDRYLVQNPPAFTLSQKQLDAVYALDYQRQQHPFYEQQGTVKALETIQFSIPTHRGCYGECNFCAIAVHEGRTVSWRSPVSIQAEAEKLAARPDFKGYIFDLGGPTANMYGFECQKKLLQGVCDDRRCLYPEICPALKINHAPQIDLLKRIRKIKGVKKVFVSSGLRYDMILADHSCGQAYLKELVEKHVSGQLKVAPEHTNSSVLHRMGKPKTAALIEFKRRFDQLSHQAEKQQFLTYYLIAAYPGCSAGEMRQLKQFVSDKLKIHPEQVQIFTPTPSTYASLMYYTERDPFTGEPLFVEKDLHKKSLQKQIIVAEDNEDSHRRDRK